MKDSGVDWIGAIPASWETRKNKYIFDILKRIAGREGYDILSVTQRGLRVKDIDSGEGQLAKDYSGYQRVYPGDFVMNHMDLLTGWVDCSTLCGVTSPDYRVFRPKKSTPVVRSYFKYIFQYCYANKVFYNFGSGVAGFGRWRLQAPAFNNFVMPFPSLSEQERIVDYLDERCAAIDEVRRTIEDEVEALRRLRKATIHRAVTKGLDEGVPMRDSGIHWAGSVPSAFEVKQLKRVAWLGNGSDPKMDGNTPVYGSGQESFKTCGEYKLGPCVLLGRKGATLHIPHYIEGRYWNVDTAFDAKTIGLNCLKWFYYLACCLDYDYYKTYTVRPSMTASDYLSMVIPVPSVIEQQRIADYLDERCDAIDSVIDARTKQLERLEDYRKALIFAYVTGKKEVPTHA